MNKQIPPIETVLEQLAYHLAKSGPVNRTVAKVILTGYVDAPDTAPEALRPIVGFSFAPAVPAPRKLRVVRSKGGSQ